MSEIRLNFFSFFLYFTSRKCIEKRRLTHVQICHCSPRLHNTLAYGSCEFRLGCNDKLPALVSKCTIFTLSIRYFLCIFISAERRPLLDIGRISVHLVGGVPTLRLPVRDCHSRTFRPYRPSVLRAICPAHCPLSLAILLATGHYHA
ncbi:hypothetical protein PYW08_010804 [Mythimna loreyi]|uniref:Uncharacterized protein n=1 Tax=Mythimna loreyi TaxID=667449 RepID=A0ACC2Q6S3_9NEOP|nr:hypothetical protein PYW08_010804 [Mythimna loreyi]